MSKNADIIFRCKDCETKMSAASILANTFISCTTCKGKQLVPEQSEVLNDETNEEKKPPPNKKQDNPKTTEDPAMIDRTKTQKIELDQITHASPAPVAEAAVTPAPTAPKESAQAQSTNSFDESLNEFKNSFVEFTQQADKKISDISSAYHADIRQISALSTQIATQESEITVLKQQLKDLEELRTQDNLKISNINLQLMEKTTQIAQLTKDKSVSEKKNLEIVGQLQTILSDSTIKQV